MESLEMHQDFMSSIGMVINNSKTELIVFSRGGPSSLMLDLGITSAKTIRTLGRACQHIHHKNIIYN